MTRLFLGNPSNGIIAIACIPTLLQVGVRNTSLPFSEPSALPLLGVTYDSRDASSAACLLLSQGMKEAGATPQVYVWEENARTEIAIFFSLSNPRDKVWRRIVGVYGLAWSACQKIYTTCETDFPAHEIAAFTTLYRQSTQAMVIIGDLVRPVADFMCPAFHSKPDPTHLA